jgi:polyhydroxyalkanoate synthesis regulator phasin
MADASNQLFDMWKKQVEEGSQAWLKMLGTPQAAPMDPQAFWRPFMDQGIAAWSRVMTQGQAPPDLLAQWKQFLDQWIDAWSRALGQAMNTDAYAKMMGEHLNQWLVANAPVKKAVDQQIDSTLQSLNMASRTQLISVAKQIVELEERLERMEDGINAILKRLDTKEPT